MTGFTSQGLEEALSTLGQYLESESMAFELVVIGGGSLLLQGSLRRTTEDLDVVARIEDGAYVTAEPFPEALRQAAHEVAGLHSLGSRWLNAGPTELLRFGMPPGFDERKETRRYGGLTLHLAGRLDQIAFKLYAAVDLGPRSKHVRDLKDLVPTRDELLFGARWAITHDPSPAFRDQLVQALASLGVRDADLA
jgi:hypothetical protein